MERNSVKLFLCGDLMTGRGIDQILPHPCDPRLFERFASSALDYVKLAEGRAGPVRRPVAFDYIWGDALAVLEAARPDARIGNLETAITTSDAPWPGKGIHYRMHPANVRCLTAAGLDCCTLANNHVLDWGEAGLTETLASLHGAGIRTTGAGLTAREATAPVSIDLGSGVRVLVHAVALASSGAPPQWRATSRRPGVHWLPDTSGSSFERLAAGLAPLRRRGELVALSIHWGSNWGYEISAEERAFAHRLIDEAGVDLVHGHSSHHVKGIEVYRRRAILYGCGDLVNDYEGIGGYEAYRAELGLMYFPVLNAASGELRSLSTVPTRMHALAVHRAREADIAWLRATMDRECRALDARVTQRPDETLSLEWC